MYKKGNLVSEYDINVIRLVQILSTGRPMSKKDIAEKLEISTRYVERIIQTVKENYAELLVIEKKGKGRRILYEIIKNGNHLPITMIMPNLGEKIDRNIYKDYSLQRNFKVVVSDIKKAIDSGFPIELIYDNMTIYRKIYNILPLEIILCHDLKIAAIDLKIPDRWCIFSLTEDAVLKIDYKSINQDIPTPKPELDDFFLFSNVSNHEKPKSAKLILTQDSKDHTMRLLPHLKKRVKKLNNEDALLYKKEMLYFKYELVIKFYSIDSLGSLISGMLNHFKVIASDDVIAQLQQYIEQNIIDKIESNLIIK